MEGAKTHNVLVKKSSSSRSRHGVRVVPVGGLPLQRTSSARLARTQPEEPSTFKRVELPLSCRSLPPSPQPSNTYRPPLFLNIPPAPSISPPSPPHSVKSDPTPCTRDSLQDTMPLLQPIRKHPIVRKPAAVPTLSLQTSNPEIRPMSQDTVAVSPLPPDIPIAPSPATARRKRMSKLRRHLGECLPADCLEDCPNHRKKVATPPHTHRPNRLRHRAVHNAVLRARIKEEDSDGTISEDDKLKSDWVFVHGGTTFKNVPLNRYSKKWIVEKGGRRQVDEDYNDVLRRLRAL